MFRLFSFVSLLLFLHSCKSDHPTSKEVYEIKTIAPSRLIDPLVANQILSMEAFLFIPIQVSKKETFKKGHLPKAFNIWRPDYGAENSKPFGGLMASKNKIEELLQSFGVTKDHTLLLYDAKGNVDALRFAWVLKYYGFNNYKILNGGLANWQKEGLTLSTTPSSVSKHSTFQLGDSLNSKILATSSDLLKAIDDDNTLILDTREDYEFLGEPFISKGEVLMCKKGASVRGSIPTAIHLNWSMLADLNGDHKIKPLKDLEYDLAERGITKDKNIILYCQSGSRTSHTFFVLTEILGYENVKNYDGSWIEWSYLNKKNKNYPIQQLCNELEFTSKMDSLILLAKN